MALLTTLDPELQGHIIESWTLSASVADWRNSELSELDNMCKP